MEDKNKRKIVLSIDTYFPNSKLCSICGYKTDITNDLSVREWECKNCGVYHDRE